MVEVALLFVVCVLKGEKTKDKAYPTEITTIGDAIRARRLDLGLKQREVAAIIGCDQMSVLNWEKGYNKPIMINMAGVRRFLSVHYPNWIGHDQFREFKFEGSHLLLSSPPIVSGGESLNYVLTWERVS